MQEPGGAESPPRLAMSAVGKSFGAVSVLRDVDLTLMPGEIHGLIGQNGAGKSTLTRILAGAHHDYTGSIAIDGRPVDIRSPRDAMQHGVAVIYQEFSLVPSMTVAENIALGVEPGRLSYSAAATRRLASEWLARAGVADEVPLEAPVASLSAAARQRVEIAKALSRNASVLVLDEPTSRLAGPDRERLFMLMRRIAAAGTSLIFISHFLEDVLAITERLTVLRDGAVVEAGPTSSFDRARLGALMLGEAVQERRHTPPPVGPTARTTVLSTTGLSCGHRVEDVSITVGAGEIVGLSGLVGSGRSTVARALVGATRVRAGTIEIGGREVSFRNPREARKAGVVLVPEDRRAEGLIGVRSATENVAALALSNAGRWGFVSRRQVRRLGEEAVVRFEVRPPDGNRRANTFSGGNQQKLLLARAILAEPSVLIVDQPTAGVDVGAVAQIHHILRSEAGRGAGVLLVSDDLDEVLTLCDRVYVMRRGTIVTEVARADLSRDALLSLM